LSIAGSRRRALGAALSGALAALGVVHADEARAARSAKCRRKPGECERCDRGKCEKRDGKKRCRRGKIKAKAFGTPCSIGTCQGRTCVAAGGASACTPGLTNCGGVCRNLNTEKANCGACGRECPGANQACCSGVCRNLNRDENNCGACGEACPAGEICERGDCVAGP
jgi:hypothetical protein